MAYATLRYQEFRIPRINYSLTSAFSLSPVTCHLSPFTNDYLPDFLSLLP